MSDDRRTRDFDPRHPDLAPAGGPRRLRDEPLLRLLVVNWLIGAGVAAALTAVVLVTDTAHLRTLILSSNEPWIGLILLVFGFMVTMCSVAMGTAIMMLPRDDDDDKHGGSPLEVLTLPKIAPPMTPAPVRVTPSRRR